MKKSALTAALSGKEELTGTKAIPGEPKMPYSIRYHFRQSFSVPAREAYRWCTRYDSQDHTLMRIDAERQVMKISEATILLTDIFQTVDGRVEKQKLIQLYPDGLTWISTHLSGPNKYSQFIYKIAADGDQASKLDFTALHMGYEKEWLDKKGIRLLANKLRKEDSAVWKLLAKEMKNALRKSLNKGKKQRV